MVSLSLFDLCLLHDRSDFLSTPTPSSSNSHMLTMLQHLLATPLSNTKMKA